MAAEHITTDTTGIEGGDGGEPGVVSQGRDRTKSSLPRDPSVTEEWRGEERASAVPRASGTDTGHGDGR